MTQPSWLCDGVNHVRHVGDAGWRIDGHGSGVWAKRRVANGTFQLVWTCGRCAYSSSSVPHAIATGAVGVFVDELPWLADYVGNNPPCQVDGCDESATEEQHWFPRAVDAEKAARYPKGYLCRRHHEEWGNLVTPNLNPPKRAA